MNKRLFVLACALLLFGAVVYAEDSSPAQKTDTQNQDSKEKASTETVVAPAAPSLKDVLAAPTDESIKNILPVDAPQDKFNRGTPRGSILSLGTALRAGDFEHAADFLDLRNLPQAVAEQGGAELVRKLSIVSQRSFWVDIDSVSNDPEGTQNDGLPAYRDRITRLDTVDGPIDILMQRVPGEDGQSIWKVSNRTVAKIPELYAQFGYGKIGDKLSRIFPHYEFLALQLWQWFVLLGIIFVAYVISWLITALSNVLLRRYVGKPTPRIQRFIARPLRFLLVVVITRANFDLLGASLSARSLFEAKTLYIVAMAWVIMGLADVVLGRIGDRKILGGGQAAVTLLGPAATALKIGIFLVAVIIWLDNMGFKVTTLVAGLGVGSIAVALAAQKSIENLIGAITMYAAQPVHVGDFCRIGDTVGTVEELGLRATVIRALDRTLVSIPNAAFANDKIENISKRDKFLFRRKIRLRIDTSPDQLRVILVEIRSLLYSHGKVDAEPARVRFVEFGEHSLNIEIFAYINSNDINDFLGVAEDINLHIMDIIATSGSRLAIPAQSIQIDQVSDSNEALVKEAETQVALWREQGALNLPEFSAESRAKLKGTLAYPPKGSASKTDISS